MFRLIKKRIGESAVFIVRKTPLAAAITLVLCALALMPANAKADVVSDWNKIADTAVVTNARRPAGAALVDMAYVHAAIYDAVNAIDRGYTVYAVAPANMPAPDTSKDAAAATAAFRVLLKLFPAQESFLTEKYSQYLETIADDARKTAGIELGNEIAQKFMALRSNDGRDAVIPFTPWTGPGNWQPTPPSFSPNPLTPWMATMKPFLIESPSQFRPAGPPALNSVEFAADYNETRAYGAINSTVRTAEQTQIGLFYIDHTGAQLSRIFRQFAAVQNMRTADNARLYAMLYLSIADSLIAGWDAKYYYHFWRPVTAIRAGDTDGNELTEADPNWLPLATTPGHPEYPAAHGCLTAAYAEALRAFFGTKKVKITLSSTTTNSTREFDNTDDLIKEIIDARIFGGMHYRTSVRDGANIGKKVTHWMTKNYFQPVP
jgi:hypothetical protein